MPALSEDRQPNIKIDDDQSLGLLKVIAGLLENTDTETTNAKRGIRDHLPMEYIRKAVDACLVECESNEFTTLDVPDPIEELSKQTAKLEQIFLDSQTQHTSTSIQIHREMQSIMKQLDSMENRIDQFESERAQISGGMSALIDQSHEMRSKIRIKHSELEGISDVISRVIPTPGFIHGLLNVRMENNITMGRLLMCLHMKLHYTSIQANEESSQGVPPTEATALSTLPDLIYLKYVVIGRIRDFLLEQLAPLEPSKGVYQTFQRNLAVRYPSYHAYLAAFHPNSAWVFRSNYQLKMQRIYTHQVSLYTKLLLKRLDKTNKDIHHSPQLLQVIHSTQRNWTGSMANAMNFPAVSLLSSLWTKTADEIEVAQEYTYPLTEIQIGSLFKLLAPPAKPIVPPRASSPTAQVMREVGWSNDNGDLMFTEILRSTLTLLTDTMTFEVLILKRLFWVADRQSLTWVSDETTLRATDDFDVRVDAFGASGLDDSPKSSGATTSSNAPMQKDPKQELANLTRLMHLMYRSPMYEDKIETAAATRAGDLAANLGVPYNEVESSLLGQVHMGAYIWGPAINLVIEMTKARFQSISNTYSEIHGTGGIGAANLIEIAACYRIAESFGRLLHSRKLGLLSKRLIEPILSLLVSACKKNCSATTDIIQSVATSPEPLQAHAVVKSISSGVITALAITTLKCELEDVTVPQTSDCHPSDDVVRIEMLGKPMKQVIDALDTFLEGVSIREGTDDLATRRYQQLDIVDHFLGVYVDHRKSSIKFSTSCDGDGRQDLFDTANPKESTFGRFQVEVPFRNQTNGVEPNSVSSKLMDNTVHPSFTFWGSLCGNATALQSSFLKYKVMSVEASGADVSKEDGCLAHFKQDLTMNSVSEAWVRQHSKLSDMVVDDAIKSNIGNMNWLSEISRAAIALYEDPTTESNRFDHLLALARSFKEDLPNVIAGLSSIFVNNTKSSDLGTALYQNASSRMYLINLQLADAIDLLFEQHPISKDLQMLLVDQMIAPSNLLEQMSLP